MINVINVISDTNMGGAGKCLLNYLALYDKKKFNIEVFIPKGSLLKPEIEKLDVPVIEVLGINDESLNISNIGYFRKIFVQKKPHIVHTHAAMSARIAAKLTKACHVVHTRHSVFDQPEEHKKFPIKQIRGNINNFLSDVIIAVSPAAKENLTDTGTNPKKIKVVYNGVEKVEQISKESKTEIRKKYSLNEWDFVVAIIARLEDVKGHQYVLDAGKILKETHPHIKILIAGTGTLENFLRQRAKDECLDNIIFTGFIKEIYLIENIMDLQLNSSYGTEATSLSLLEGMSLGKPAIVSDFGGNPYVIKNGINGFVVPKKDPLSLADNIIKLNNDKTLYKTLESGALKVFEEQFTSHAMVSKISHIYENLAR